MLPADPVPPGAPRTPLTRTIPDYDAFSARAKEIADAIPPQFMEGVEEVVVHRELERSPILPEVVTLGECESAGAAVGLGREAGDEVRSIVHLYYGSFVDLARSDPTFDLDAELVETIEHEIQHHIEDKAGVHDLEDDDDLYDAHARFRADLDVPAGWYRRGERLAPGVYAVDLDLFVELPLRKAEFERLRGRRKTLTILDESVDVEIPEDGEPEEVFTLEGAGLLEDEHDDSPDAAAGDLHIVHLVR